MNSCKAAKGLYIFVAFSRSRSMQNTPSVLRLSNTPTFTPSFLLSELSLNRRMSQDIFARFCMYVSPWNLKSVWCTLELSFHRNMSHDKSRKRFSRWIMHVTQDQIQQAVKSSAVLAWYWIVPALRQAFHLLRVRWRRLGKASPLARCSRS